VSSYLALRRWIDAGKVRPLHYLWGDEYSLIEDAVRGLRQGGELVTVTATKRNGGEVWTVLNQFPADERKRYVVVRDAHRMRDFTPLESWRKAMVRRVSACFVGDEHDFDQPLWRTAKWCPRGHRVEEAQLSRRSGREIRYCPECRAAREVFTRLGRVVRCGRPTTERARNETVAFLIRAFDAEAVARGKDALERLEPVPRGMVGALLEECGWSLGEALIAKDRLALLNVPYELPLTDTAIKQAVVSTAVGDYVAALRHGDRATAASVAHEVDPDEVPAVLRECERWLGQAQRAHSSVRAGLGTTDLIRLLGVGWGEAKRLERDAGKYSAASVSRATEALAAADRVWHQDCTAAVCAPYHWPRPGVLELLALNW
jgi:hypothetical protein